MPSVTWKIVYSSFFFILWSYAVLLCLIDIREKWQGGHGRVSYMLGFTNIPPSAPAIPLLFLPILACRRVHMFLVICSLMLLAVGTVCLTVTMVVLQEQSLHGMKDRLLIELQDKYGHGSANNESYIVFTQSMDYAQYTFQCCGVNGDKDYIGSNWYKDNNSGLPRLVPPSCCVPETQTGFVNISHSGTPINVVSRVFYGMLEEGWQNPKPKHESTCQSNNHTLFASARYTIGCSESIKKWVRREYLSTAILHAVLVVLEIIGVVYCIGMRFVMEKFEHTRREMCRCTEQHRDSRGRNFT